MSFQFVRTRVEIILASSPWPEADALLLPANNYLWMATGPARDVKQAAGEEVERAAVRAGPIALGEVAITPAGALPLAGILHVAVMGQDLAFNGDAASQGVRRALQLAGERRWLRLLLHSCLSAARSGGREGIRPMLAVLVEELLEGHALTALTLLAADEKERKLMHDALLGIVQSHR